MKKLVLLLGCMLALSGCTKSNIVNTTEETRVGNPEFETQENVEIEWLQASEEAEAIFLDQETYEYSRDFEMYLQPETKNLKLVWVVADDFPDDEILNYADELIKGFNDVVASQDFSIEKSSEDSYGGLWKDYGLEVAIAPETTKDIEESWILDFAFAAGQEFIFPEI